LIITCLWRSLYAFVEFAHQYSIVKDLKIQIAAASRNLK